MGNGTDNKDIWAEIKSIRQDMLAEVKEGAEHQKNTAVMVADIKADIRSHIQEKNIHHSPPCFDHKTLVNRLWAIAAAVIGLVIHQVVKHVG
jgi:ABC-type thiamine transport system ATPase subunit